MRRSIPLYQEEIDEIQLHAFGDASGRITRAGDCEVLSSETRSYDSSVGARVVAVNLIANVPQALEGLTLVTSDHCRLDSSVALHWIADCRGGPSVCAESCQ